VLESKALGIYDMIDRGQVAIIVNLGILILYCGLANGYKDVINERLNTFSVNASANIMWSFQLKKM
jgi:hypothetical protein